MIVIMIVIMIGAVLVAMVVLVAQDLAPGKPLPRAFSSPAPFPGFDT